MIKHPQRVDYAIGLVIYYPEISLLKRIEQMVNLGFNVYVFDNSPFVASNSLIIQDNPCINYLTAGKNVGLGYSLTTLCATAYAHGFTQLLFLDQDTGISTQTLEYITNFHQTVPIESQQQYAAMVFNGQTASEYAVEEVCLAISSGSLFNLKVLQQVGWHNENFFVDCVDYELCLRARRYGFKIGLIRNTPDFDHVTEQPDQTFHLLGKQLLVRRYSTTRIRDALGAYLKLIFGGLFQNKPSDTWVLTRSLGLYIFGQLVVRLIQRK
jgi:GT2 family glycosyltransferase